jgi:biopolymer transport protein ExbD
MIQFQRTTKPFRGQLDLAAFLCVLLPLAFALLFHQFLVLPRGARLELPVGDAGPAVAPGEPLFIVAVDANEQLYFENQMIGRTELAAALKARAAVPDAPQTLLIQPDRTVRYERLVELASLARAAGVRSVIYGIRPVRRP